MRELKKFTQIISTEKLTRSKFIMGTVSRFFLSLFSVFSLTILMVMYSCGGGGGGGGDNSPDKFTTLTWDAPTTNADGGPITNFIGQYKIYYGVTTGNYTGNINLTKTGTPVITQVTLSEGTYYFVVTAINTYGNESGFSNEVRKVIE